MPQSVHHLDSTFFELRNVVLRYVPFVKAAGTASSQHDTAAAAVQSCCYPRSYHVRRSVVCGFETASCSSISFVAASNSVVCHCCQLTNGQMARLAFAQESTRNRRDTVFVSDCFDVFLPEISMQRAGTAADCNLLFTDSSSTARIDCQKHILLMI
jgi:hypothetical protein